MSKDANEPQNGTEGDVQNTPRVVVEVPGYWALTDEDRATLDEMMKRRAALRDHARDMKAKKDAQAKTTK